MAASSTRGVMWVLERIPSRCTPGSASTSSSSDSEPSRSSTSNPWLSRISTATGWMFSSSSTFTVDQPRSAAGLRPKPRRPVDSAFAHDGGPARHDAGHGCTSCLGMGPSSSDSSPPSWSPPCAAPGGAAPGRPAAGATVAAADRPEPGACTRSRPGRYEVAWTSPDGLPDHLGPADDPRARRRRRWGSRRSRPTAAPCSAVVTSRDPADPATPGAWCCPATGSTRPAAARRTRLAPASKALDLPGTETLPVDPATPGPYAVTSSDYQLDPVKLPGMPQPIEMVGHVVEPAAGAATGPRPLVLLLHGRHNYCYDPSGEGRGRLGLALPGAVAGDPEPPRLRLRPAGARLAGLRDRVGPGQRDQRAGLPARRRRCRCPGRDRRAAPRPLDRPRGRPPGRPRPGRARRPQPRRRGRRPGRDPDPAQRAVPDRRPGAGRARPTSATRPRRTSRRSRCCPSATATSATCRASASPTVARDLTDGRHLAEELGPGDGRQPQLLQHRVDAGHLRGTVLRRLGRATRPHGCAQEEPRPAQREGAAGGRDGVRRRRGPPLRRRRAGLPAALRRDPRPGRLDRRRAGAQPRDRRWRECCASPGVGTGRSLPDGATTRFCHGSSDPGGSPAAAARRGYDVVDPALAGGVRAGADPAVPRDVLDRSRPVRRAGPRQAARPRRGSARAAHRHRLPATRRRPAGPDHRRRRRQRAARPRPVVGSSRRSTMGDLLTKNSGRRRWSSTRRPRPVST